MLCYFIIIICYKKILVKFYSVVFSNSLEICHQQYMLKSMQINTINTIIVIYMCRNIEKQFKHFKCISHLRLLNKNHNLIYNSLFLSVSKLIQ
jgi:hypothetical protein